MKTAVVICPGRGTYGKAELGTLGRCFNDPALLASFNAKRSALQQETLTQLDSAPTYSIARHTRGDNASALIYAASYADFQALREIEVVAVTGNSMGWYTALACAGALTPETGFDVVNTMGTLMQKHLIGGQVIHPFMSEDWQADPARKSALLTLVQEISRRPEHVLCLSIDLGGFLVLAGNDQGLRAFEAAVPPTARFPMRLHNHAAFHSHLQAPVAEAGRIALPSTLFGQPKLPLIDGSGTIWWPHACDPQALWAYTLGRQVIEPYDFSSAIRTAAREFAPDLFIITGPGTTLGGAVAQSLILANWQGMTCKADFQRQQAETAFLVSMGLPDQRPSVSRRTQS